MADQHDLRARAGDESRPRDAPWSPADRWRRARTDCGAPPPRARCAARHGPRRSPGRRYRAPRRVPRRKWRPWRAGSRPRSGCARSRGAHRPAARKSLSARSTDSMARTTPAQKPRGEHSSTLSAGFSGALTILSSKSRRFFANFKPRHGPRRPALSSRDGCMGPTQSLYSGHFPIITDDLVLRPTGGRSVEEILPWRPQHH